MTARSFWPLTLLLPCAWVLAACSLAPASPSTPASASTHFVPSRAQFDALFPERIDFYTYEGFVAAVRATPGFADTGSEAAKRQEMAAFLGQISHESDQLRALREYRRENWDHYCRTTDPFGCAPGQQYYGRGPIQLSWNYQYKAAGEALGLNLWAQPDQVATDAVTAWRTALWYWMVQPGESAHSAHQALHAGLGFAGTTRAINGTLECNKPGDAAVARRQQRRIDFYTRASELFGAALQLPLGC